MGNRSKNKTGWHKGGGSGIGSITDAQNIGAGEGVYSGKSGALNEVLNFKSLVGADGVTLEDLTETISIGINTYDLFSVLESFEAGRGNLPSSTLSNETYYASLLAWCAGSASAVQIYIESLGTTPTAFDAAVYRENGTLAVKASSIQTPTSTGIFIIDLGSSFSFFKGEKLFIAISGSIGSNSTLPADDQMANKLTWNRFVSPQATIPVGALPTGLSTAKRFWFRLINVPEDIVYIVYIVSPSDGYKVNLLSVPVAWFDRTGTLVNDFETVASHEYATDVTITRGNIGNQASVTISHKTGIPVADLLYYRDDLGVRVDFNGVYTVPGTITSPVTLGWSITNGNASGTIEQPEFDETLSNGTNSVVLPDFTDDWGNNIAVGDRTFSVVFGADSMAEIVIDFVTGQTVGVRPASISSTGSDTNYAMTFQTAGTIVDSSGFIGFSMEDARTSQPYINHTGSGLADPWLKDNQTIFLVYKRVFGVYSPVVYGDYNDTQGFSRLQHVSNGDNTIRTNYSNTRIFGKVFNGNIVAECVKLENLYLMASDTLGNTLIDLVQSNPFVTDKRFNMGTDNKNVVARLEIWGKTLSDQECSDRLAVLADMYGTTQL